jgi:hypothetical protein
MNVAKNTGFSIALLMFCIASTTVRSAEACRPGITEQA